MLINKKDRNPYQTMTTYYATRIDFKDKRFVFIPGDISELLVEMETLYPRMNTVALGECGEQDVIMELDYIQSRLWHLIDHATSLDAALQTLMAVIDATDDEEESATCEQTEDNLEGDKGVSE